MSNETKDLEIGLDGLEGKIVYLRVEPEGIRYVGKFKKFIHIDSRTTVVLTDCVCFYDGPGRVIKIDEEKGKYKIVYPKGWLVSELILAKYDKASRIEVYDKVKNDTSAIET